jgi:hypothetical protein
MTFQKERGGAVPAPRLPAMASALRVRVPWAEPVAPVAHPSRPNRTTLRPSAEAGQLLLCVGRAIAQMVSSRTSRATAICCRPSSSSPSSWSQSA